jgi:PEP-CTERM motif
MRTRQIRTLAMLIVVMSLVAVLPIPAHADGITLTLSPVSGCSGTTVTVDGTITNNSSNTVYLNSESFTLPSPLINGDTTDFFLNAPLSLAPDTNSGLIALFAFQIAPGTPQGVYLGNFLDIIGGGPSDFTDVLASSEFAVTATPEPATLPLFGTAVLIAGAFVLRRKRTPYIIGENIPGI